MGAHHLGYRRDQRKGDRVVGGADGLSFLGGAGSEVETALSCRLSPCRCGTSLQRSLFGFLEWLLDIIVLTPDGRLAPQAATLGGGLASAPAAVAGGWARGQVTVGAAGFLAGPVSMCGVRDPLVCSGS